ncbi:MAG: class I tRNA ligase family protein, partial [Candidatus Azambacteria bacterium]|nr:class I tRNA ligase family protein [Candidatus Azambacteria bacterium]
MHELFNPKTEEKILDFWKREQIFEKSLSKNAKGKKFVFYEGPPFPNAKAHIGNILTRCYKDAICRYKNMAGFNTIGRRAGWDVHGLPVELQLEKKLGFRGKPDIEKYGIAEFNGAARQMVFGYKDDWDKLTERIGFWIDSANYYITSDPRYMESLWQIVARIWKKKLLYRDFKVVPYCARCGTSLSNFEVAQGYKKVVENSVYIKFKLKPNQKIGADGFVTTDNTFIISWTTTPWTLPGNAALAVGEKIEYEILELADNKIFIFAKDLSARGGSASGGKDSIIEEQKIKSSFILGKNLLGLQYDPLFSVPQLKSKNSYKIYSADFVNIEEGTGVVHIAPMYGVDDFNLGAKTGLPKAHTVDLEGKFIKGIGFGLDGAYVKSDKTEAIILDYLKNNENLLRVKKYEHDYPFCWRCHSPLLYYAKSSWFIGMEKLRKRLLENNKKINWVPAHIKNGRFGGWLDEVKDWAFSRERYWGTPLPVWQCQKCENEQVIGSLEELDKFSPKKLNKYIFLRHGEAENNRTGVLSSWPEKKKFPLTLKGAGEIEKLIPWFRKKKIDLIFSSDLLRAKETAEIIAGALGKKIIYDQRLREHDFGIYNGAKAGESIKSFGENLSDIKKRVMDFLKFLDAKYEGKNILIISHGNPLMTAAGAYRGYKNEENLGLKEVIDFRKKTGSVFEMAGRNWPYNNEGELDLHRPYTDNLILRCSKCSGKMKRVPEVIDVWFDSG